MANKVKFNICNVHYALFDKTEEGVIKYKTPVPMPVLFQFHWILMESLKAFMQMELNTTLFQTIWDMMEI